MGMGEKVCICFRGHITKNQKSNDLETWHEASGSQVLQSLYK